MDRKSLIAFVAIFLLAAGIGFVAWSDQERGDSAEDPNKASFIQE